MHEQREKIEWWWPERDLRTLITNLLPFAKPLTSIVVEFLPVHRYMLILNDRNLLWFDLETETCGPEVVCESKHEMRQIVRHPITGLVLALCYDETTQHDHLVAIHPVSGRSTTVEILYSYMRFCGTEAYVFDSWKERVLRTKFHEQSVAFVPDMSGYPLAREIVWINSDLVVRLSVGEQGVYSIDRRTRRAYTLWREPPLKTKLSDVKVTVGARMDLYILYSAVGSNQSRIVHIDIGTGHTIAVLPVFPHGMVASDLDVAVANSMVYVLEHNKECQPTLFRMWKLEGDSWRCVLARIAMPKSKYSTAILAV